MTCVTRGCALSFTLAGLLLGAVSPSMAAIVVYTNRTDFEAASTGLTTIDFEGLAPASSFTFYASPPGLSVGPVNFQSLTDSLFVIDPNFDFPSFVFNSGQYLIDNTFESDPARRGLVVTLPAGITAVGTDLSSFDLGDITVTLGSGEVFLVPSPGQPDYTFIGFSSTSAIASIKFSKTTGNPNEFGDSVVLDNFSYGVRMVPEPSTLALAGVGGLILLVYGRRRAG